MTVSTLDRARIREMMTLRPGQIGRNEKGRNTMRYGIRN